LLDRFLVDLVPLLRVQQSVGAASISGWMTDEAMDDACQGCHSSAPSCPVVCALVSGRLCRTCALVDEFASILSHSAILHATLPTPQYSSISIYSHTLHATLPTLHHSQVTHVLLCVFTGCSLAQQAAGLLQLLLTPCFSFAFQAASSFASTTRASTLNLKPPSFLSQLLQTPP
jgi:hypothetical protein